ncbi:MAG: penicillin acylase family protein [Bacteroidales bacterium]
MKILRVVLVSFLVLILMGAIAGGVFIRYSSRKALPDYNKDVVMNNISDSVLVIRDATGMPHIYANTEKELYQAAGYLMAQDRMWQMDLLRRLTTGRLSEILGKDLVETDQLFRALHFTQKSRIIIDSCSAEVNSYLQAYADGVNQYLEDNWGKLPPEFSILGYEPEPWEPIYSLNLIGYMSWSLTAGWSTEDFLFRLQEKLEPRQVQALIPEVNYQETYVYPELGKREEEAFVLLKSGNSKISELGLQVFMASNNWAVSPSKSANGKAIMANDMHLELNAPGIWYQMHQVVEGKLNISGLVLPGQPFIICGHNEDVAWGMTNVSVDNIDFYLEILKEEDTTQYLLDGEWKDLRLEKEIIYTKEGDTIEVYNRFTHRGPIISKFKDFSDKAVSMRWMGNEYSNEMKTVYLFNRMRNWEDFREAARTFVAISQNIVYADKEGNIGMLTAAGIPIREGKGIFVYPGDTSLYDWKGIVPFEELPAVFNPERGFVASANNRTVGEEYPYYISNWFDTPHRVNRIVEMLTEEGKLSVEDMKAIQSNHQSKFAENVLPFYLEVIAGKVQTGTEFMQTVHSLLETWDYNFGIESVEATIFEQMNIEFLNLLLRDELGDSLYREFLGNTLFSRFLLDNIAIERNSPWFDNINTTDKAENAEDLVFSALENTIDHLRKRLGNELTGWQWGKVHTLTLEHPLGSVDALNRAFKLNRGPYSVGGSSHTVSPFSYSMNNPFKAFHGSSQRHIYIPGEWDQSLIIIPTGISGIPASDHYCDQTEKYLNYEYNPELFSREVVFENKAYSMKFFKDQDKD